MHHLYYLAVLANLSSFDEHIDSVAYSQLIREKTKTKKRSTEKVEYPEKNETNEVPNHQENRSS